MTITETKLIWFEHFANNGEEIAAFYAALFGWRTISAMPHEPPEAVEEKARIKEDRTKAAHVSEEALTTELMPDWERTEAGRAAMYGLHGYDRARLFIETDWLWPVVGALPEAADPGEYTDYIAGSLIPSPLDRNHWEAELAVPSALTDDDLKELSRLLKGAGATPLTPFVDILPYATFAHVVDPFGVPFKIVRMRPSPEVPGMGSKTRHRGAIHLSSEPRRAQKWYRKKLGLDLRNVEFGHGGTQDRGFVPLLAHDEMPAAARVIAAANGRFLPFRAEDKMFLGIDPAGGMFALREEKLTPKHILVETVGRKPEGETQ